MIPIRPKVNIAWISAADMYPADTLNFKREFLKQVFKQEHVLVLSHETESFLCKVKFFNGKYRAEEFSI